MLWFNTVCVGSCLLARFADWSPACPPTSSLPCCRQEPRLLGTLSFGPGSVICGVGLLANGLLCAAGLMASGNVQVQAWQLMGDSREVQVLPTVAAPSTVWDALQSVAGKAALSGALGLGTCGDRWVPEDACSNQGRRQGVLLARHPGDAEAAPHAPRQRRVPCLPVQT